MPARTRDRVALVVAVLAFVAGALAMLGDANGQYGPYDIRLAGEKLLPIGLALVAVGVMWPLTDRGPLRNLSITLAVATATPILLEPARMTTTQPATLVVWTLGAAASLILAFGISRELPAPQGRTLLSMAGILAVTAMAVGLVTVSGSPQGLGAGASGLLLLGAITALPGVGGAVLRYRTPDPAAARENVPDAIELTIAGLTPAIAWLTAAGSGGALSPLLPLGVWLVAAAIGTRFAIRPLVRSAARAAVQRDMTVAILEAERSRIAADIHDEALQDLTLLGWRLDTSGDFGQCGAGSPRRRAIARDMRRSAATDP